MSKTLLSIVFICLCAFNFANGQDIYFCSSYQSNGEPVGATKIHYLDEKGRYIYVLFSNHNKVIKSKKLILNIKINTSTGYQNYAKRVMKIQSGRTWALLDYQFTETGQYEISVQDKEGKVLATDYLPVGFKSPAREEIVIDSTPNNHQNQALQKDPDRNYYKAKIIFYRPGINGNPADTAFVFRAGELRILVINDRPLASDTMIVDVFKKGYETEKYPIYVTSKNFWIDGSQNRASFTINLDETGEYKIITYNRRSQTISEGFVVIR